MTWPADLYGAMPKTCQVSDAFPSVEMSPHESSMALPSMKFKISIWRKAECDLSVESFQWYNVSNDLLRSLRIEWGKKMLSI